MNALTPTTGPERMLPPAWLLMHASPQFLVVELMIGLDEADVASFEVFEFSSSAQFTRIKAEHTDWPQAFFAAVPNGPGQYLIYGYDAAEGTWRQLRNGAGNTIHQPLTRH